MRNFRFDIKNFLLGFVAMVIVLCIPMLSEPFIKITTKIREKIGGEK